jgi:carbon-monoxide dehydrogenase large subunit
VTEAFVGRAIPRKEDARLLRGRGRYTADFKRSEAVEAAVLRSPFAHAKIIHIDVTEAKGLDGVLDVLTAKDLRGGVHPFNRPFYAKVHPAVLEDTGLELRPYKAQLLGDEKVFRVGEPVALVLAADRYLAEDALELIQVEYEPLEVVADPERALDADAPVIHPEFGDNVHARFRSSRGDVEGTLESAPHVLRQRYHTHRSVGVPMETRGVVAEYDHGREELMVWAANQRPHLLRTYLSEMLSLPEESVRVVCPDMGGSFGGGIYNEEILVAYAAKRTGRPVRWIEDRQENLLNARHSRDQIHYVDVAFDDSGRILAFKDRFLVDTGAYNPFTITLSFNTAAHLRGQFKIDTFDIEAINVATNKLQTTPLRGAGRPEAAFVMDRVIDSIAVELDLDPADVRRTNLIPGDEMPYDMGMLYRDGQPMVYDSGNYPEQLDQILEMASYKELRAWQQIEKAAGRHVGIGLSAYVEGSGYGPHEGASVRIDATGKVIVHSGSNPHGQAHETTLSQVCADALGVNVDDISVRAGDTSLIQHGGGTFASRSAVTAGSAVLGASQRLRSKVDEIAAAMLEVSSQDIEVEDGSWFPTGAPDRSVTLAEIAGAASPGTGIALPVGVEPGLEAQSYFVPPTVTFASGSHLVVSEVDAETGFVRILDYFVVDECGRMLNPMVVEGQIMGAVAHGVGNAFLEEVIYNEDGQPLTGTFMDYLLPTSAEVPNMQIGHQEYLSPLNPLGAKGCGEGGTVSAPPAIANSIADAMRPLRVELNETPLTPERVRRAILEAQERAGSER